MYIYNGKSSRAKDLEKESEIRPQKWRHSERRR